MDVAICLTIPFDGVTHFLHSLTFHVTVATFLRMEGLGKDESKDDDKLGDLDVSSSRPTFVEGLLRARASYKVCTTPIHHVFACLPRMLSFQL